MVYSRYRFVKRKKPEPEISQKLESSLSKKPGISMDIEFKAVPVPASSMAVDSDSVLSAFSLWWAIPPSFLWDLERLCSKGSIMSF